jgi:hypothetical protein
MLDLAQRHACSPRRTCGSCRVIRCCKDNDHHTHSPAHIFLEMEQPLVLPKLDSSARVSPLRFIVLLMELESASLKISFFFFHIPKSTG